MADEDLSIGNSAIPDAVTIADMTGNFAGRKRPLYQARHADYDERIRRGIAVPAVPMRIRFESVGTEIAYAARSEG